MKRSFYSWRCTKWQEGDSLRPCSPRTFRPRIISHPNHWDHLSYCSENIHSQSLSAVSRPIRARKTTNIIYHSLIQFGTGLSIIHFYVYNAGHVGDRWRGFCLAVNTWSRRTGYKRFLLLVVKSGESSCIRYYNEKDGLGISLTDS